MDLQNWVTGTPISAASLNQINTAITDIEGVITSHASFIQELRDNKLNTSGFSSAAYTYLNNNIADISLNNGQFGQLELKILPSSGSTIYGLNTLMDQIKDLRNEVRAGCYKIGDIRITTTATNPTNYEDNINGDSHYYYWLPYSEGRFLLGAGGDYTSAEAEGGEAMHTLTSSEMPIHHHSLGSNWSDTLSGSANAFKTTAKRTTKTKETLDAGGGQPHNNMPPYKVVYFWKCVSETDYNNAQNSPSE